MQILSVDLENVKSYEQAQITFTQGVNAIVGHNGAGKSTILEAIGFTLFDALGYNQAEFIRGGAKSARMRVTFISSMDERAYDVERRIGSSARYTVYDPQLGAPICEGKADVLRFLRQHLNVEPSADLNAIFRDAVGVPQGTLTAAFLLNEAQRKGIFESLLRVEEYTTVWGKLREPLNLLKARKGEFENEISRLQGQLERLPPLEAEIGERVKELTRKQGDLDRATQELVTVNAKVARLKAEHDRVEQARRALDDAAAKHKSSHERHTDVEQRRLLAQSAKAAVDSSQAGHDAYMQARSKQRDLQERVLARQRIDAQRNEVNTRMARYEEQMRQRHSSLEEVAAAEQKALELHSKVVEWVRWDGELAQAKEQQARLEDARRVEAQQQQQLARLKARRADLEQQLAESQTVQAKIQAATRQSEESRKKLEVERDTLAHLKSQADLIKEQSQKLADVQTAACPVCEQPLTPGHRDEMLARNERKLDEMRANYREASKQVQNLDASLQQEQETLKALQNALLKLPREDEAAKLAEEVERGQKQLDAALSQVAALADAPQRVESISKARAAMGDPQPDYNVAKARAGQRAQLEEELARISREALTAQTQLDELQAALAAYGDLDAEVHAVSAALQQHEAAYQAVLANQTRAGELPTLTAQAAALAQELAQLSVHLAECEKGYQMAAANFDSDAFAQAERREQELIGAVGTLKGERDSLQAEQDKALRDLADLQAKRTLVDEEKAKIKHIVDQEDVLTSIRDKLRLAGPEISLALNKQISDGARQIFSDLMQDYSRHLTWNKDYSISLEVDGRECSFGQLSGGEQMSAALSVRLALLREMSNIDIAFFDEPTANLDETRREALARQILNVRGFRQIFVISHDDTFEQATQNLIRVERVGGTSRIVAS